MENSQISNLELLATGIKFVCLNVPFFYAAFNARAHFKIVNKSRHVPAKFEMGEQEVPDESFRKVSKVGISKEASICINEFLSILSKRKNITLDNFYRNVHPYFIREGRFGRERLAEYDMFERIIYYAEEIRESIFHELLHMASSWRKGYTYTCGFQQIGYDEQENELTDIGAGLNEGYTQLLTERYFRYLGDRVGVYKVPVRLASYVEVLVGREQMESLFFEGNLEGLIEALERYAPREEVVRLLKNIDYVYSSIYETRLPFPKVLSRRYYERILVSLSGMLKRKIELERENDESLRDERALFYSLRNFEHKKKFIRYAVSRKCNDMIKKDESEAMNYGRRRWA